MMHKAFHSLNIPVSAIVFFLCVSSGTSVLASTAPMTELPAPALAVMRELKLPLSGLSVMVQEVNAKQPLLSINPDQPRSPASTMKVVTTYAALELLGPAYTWKTETYLDGTLNASSGELRGDLILKGYGDPFLTTEAFWTLLRGLRDHGLRRINGGVAIDNSYFAPEASSPGAFDGRAQRAYNAIPSALMVNFQVIGLQFFPHPSGGKVKLVPDPLPANLMINNRLQLTNGRCRGRQVRLDLTPTAGGAALTVSGRYPRGCGTWLMHRILLPPEQLAYGIFQTQWQSLGGVVQNSRSVSGLRRGPVTVSGKPFYTLRSRPLAELIRGMNKYSNNVMTRQLLLTLGAERFGAPGTEAKGRRAVREWLNEKELDFPEFIIDNGAGLSRTARISARHLNQLLLDAYASPYAPELRASLPLAALDGTLKRRFRGEELSGRLRLKTGSINGVRSIAGYVLSRSGRQYAVTMLHNHPNVDKGTGTKVQNALLRWLFER